MFAYKSIPSSDIRKLQVPNVRHFNNLAVSEERQGVSATSLFHLVSTVLDGKGEIILSVIM